MMSSESYDRHYLAPDVERILEACTLAPGNGIWNVSRAARYLLPGAWQSAVCPRAHVDPSPRSEPTDGVPVSVLHLLALPCAMGFERFLRLGGVLAALSIGITGLATVTDACPEFTAHPNPLVDLHLPLLLKGQLCLKLGRVLGLPPCVSVALFCAIIAGGIWWFWRHLPDSAGRKCTGET